MNLYQIEKQYLELADRLIEQGGEVTDNQMTVLTDNKDMLDTKVINIGYVIKKFDAEVQIIEAEIKRLQDLKRVRENAKERLKERVSHAMMLFTINEIKSPLMNVSFRKSESVEVDDIEKLPVECYTLEKKVNKTEIKRLIKEGKDINGARLVTNQNIQFK